MGYWKCKECGGKVRVTVSRTISEDFNVDRHGIATGKCLKKTVGEVEGTNYYCQKCGKWSMCDEDIEYIADWVEK